VQDSAAALIRARLRVVEALHQLHHGFADGIDVSREIRTAEAGQLASKVSVVPEVRERLVAKQREMGASGDVVMEGRDIGSNVFPETEFKFYLDASLDERTRRRAAEGVQENLAARDHRDSQRAAAPLMVPLGARVINNSHLTSEQTSGLIISDVRKRLASRQ